MPDGELEIQWEGSRGRCFKLIELLAITMSLWYSVAIGVSFFVCLFFEVTLIIPPEMKVNYTECFESK